MANRVLDQVEEHALHLLGIGPGDYLARRQLGGDPHTARLGGSALRGDGVADQVPQDHRGARPRPLVQLPHHLDPVDPGEHHVEHDQVGTMQPREAEGLRAVARLVGLIAGPLHVATDDLDDRRLVADDQHLRLRFLGHERDPPRWANRR